MNRLDSHKKGLIQHFRSITNASDNAALQCLQIGEWNVEAAIDYYYQTLPATPVPPPSVDQRALQQLYQRYKDEDCDMIYADGVAQLCKDLQVDPTDVVMLVLSWHIGAATMCEYSKQEFIQGMTSLQCDSIGKLAKKLPEFRAEVEDVTKFKEIYTYAYSWALEKGIKCLQQDTAIAMWRLLFSARPWPLLDAWCKFLEQHHNRAITRDTWTQLLDFSKAVRPDLSNFEESGSAWPYLLDDFVDYVRRGHVAPGV